MAVIPPTSLGLESPVKPPMEIFKIPYPDLYDPDEEIIKYPLSSTTNTNSSIAEVSLFVFFFFCEVYISFSCILITTDVSCLREQQRRVQSSMNNAFIVSIIYSWQITQSGMNYNEQ